MSVGGTGKTPQIEYLIRLLSPNYKVATLSRGYKRKSKGFILADAHSNAEQLGDEPYQYFKKFPQIQVAVDQHTSRLIVSVAIDNLGKGAAAQAIQNANLMCGFHEGAGLSTDGLGT